MCRRWSRSMPQERRFILGRVTAGTRASASFRGSVPLVPLIRHFFHVWQRRRLTFPFSALYQSTKKLSGTSGTK